jgi:hypothetical protein
VKRRLRRNSRKAIARRTLPCSSQAVSTFTPRWRLSSSEEIPV